MKESVDCLMDLWGHYEVDQYMHCRRPRREKWWKGLERFSKEIIIENLPNLRKKTRHPDPGITINTKNDD